MFSREQIKEKATELLRQTNLIGVYPTPVDIIAEEFFGYKCYGFKPSADTLSISGAVFHDKQLLYYNVDDTLERQLFTIAHELGHIVLHKDRGNQVDYRASLAFENEYHTSPESAIEKEANMFAAEMLMPEADFKKIYMSTSGNIGKIAAHFGTSKLAISIRAKILKVSVYAA